VPETFFAAYDFAFGRENGGDLNKVLLSDARLAKRLLKRLKLVLVATNAFGKKDPGRNKILQIKP
jgi:hypothetical protein